MLSYIFLSIWPWKISLFMAGPKSNKICPQKVYISEAEIAEENNRTTSFGENDLFICLHIYFGKQLLPQIDNCCQEVIQNNEMTSPWSNHCWMLVAFRKRLPGSRVGF